MTETKNNSEKSKLNINPYVFAILLVVTAILSFFIGKNYDTIFLGKSGNNDSGPTESGNIIIKVIGDKRCLDCPTKQIMEELKKLPFLSGAKFEEMDFSDKGVKKLLKENDINALPAFLFNTKNIPDTLFVSYLKETPTGLFNLDIGAEFDPFGEICNNGKDDNDDGKTDCDDPTCTKKDVKCFPKVDRPVADLYIMSYCPYGLQAQKGYLEVMSKLSKVADINIKWVPYIMHGQKEVEENTIQYCIGKEQKEKYVKYLNCFLAEEGKGSICRKEAGINETKLTACIERTKKEFKIDEKMQDKTKPYPDFDVNKEEAIKAGVKGSPTFVLNGIKIEKIGRSAKAYADAICSTFKTKPKECNESFQDITFDPMFGFTSNGTNVSSGCGK